MRKKNNTRIWGRNKRRKKKKTTSKEQKKTEKYKDEDMICLTNLTSCDHYDSKLIIKELGNGNEEEVFIDALYL